jgi:hypothetical protein
MVLTGIIPFQCQVNWGDNLVFLRGDSFAVGSSADIIVPLLEA